MALIHRYVQRQEDIHLLVSQQFPFYRSLQKSDGSNFFDLPDPKGYLENALALGSSLNQISATNPDKFDSMVRDGRFLALGKTLPISECSAFIADKLFPDDGYQETIEQRNKCAEDYALILHQAISVGTLKMFNPHTKIAFDRSRLLPVHFNNGLIPIKTLVLCLRLQDQIYAKRLPQPEPVPVKVSKAPPPITPIRSGWNSKPLLLPTETTALAPALVFAPAISVTPEKQPTTPIINSISAAPTWVARAIELANEIALIKYQSGQREITARNIAKAVAKKLSDERDGEQRPKWYGQRGPRSHDTVRTEALKGWQFLPPLD